MIVSSDIAGNGFAFIERLMPSRSTQEIVEILGEGITLRGGNAVHQLRPQAQEISPPNSYSGIYGRSAFPMHTDLAHWQKPPRYIVLRCIKGFDAVATLVVDGSAVVRNIGERVLSRALVQPRRPNNGHLPLLRLYQRDLGSAGLLRWDEVFIRPATPAGAVGISRMKELLATVERNQILLRSPGDTLIIDNWRVLHGRSSIAEACTERIIERAYLGALN